MHPISTVIPWLLKEKKETSKEGLNKLNEYKVKVQGNNEERGNKKAGRLDLGAGQWRRSSFPKSPAEVFLSNTASQMRGLSKPTEATGSIIQLQPWQKASA